MQQTQAPWLKDLLILTIILGGLFFILLGSRPLFVPDEGRYAEIAREMVASGNYITPYLNGIKYFEKPALFYWLSAGAIHLGGLNLWSLRSVNAILGLLGCLLTYCTIRQLYNRNTALLTALILGTSTLYFVMTRMISLDLTVTFFLAITLYAFLLGINSQNNRTRRLFLWAASLACAFAVLTKGLIGIVFPVIIISIWIAIMKEWRLLLKIYIPSCLLIFLLAAAPWHILVNQHNPEFFYFYFIQQHFLRYTTLNIGHYQPVWFFIPALVAGFFPWIVFLPQTFFALWKNDKNRFDMFFLIWTLVIFVFFSLSKSKLIPYILPIFPPLSILTARYLAQAIRHKTLRGVNIGFAVLFLFSIAIAGTFYFFTLHADLPNPLLAKRNLYAASAILVIGTFIACVYHSRQIFKALILIIACTWLFLLLAFSAMPYLDTRSILPLANLLNASLTDQDEVIAYNQYYQDLPFYLKRRITILNWENEMKYGMQHQDTRAWMINDQTFWQRFHSKRRIFTIMGKSEYQNFILRHAGERYYLVGETGNNVLISNQKVLFQ